MADMNKTTQDETTEQNQNNSAKNDWASLLGQINGERNKKVKDKVKQKLADLIAKKAEAEKAVRIVDQEIMDLRDKYENGEIE